MFDVRCATRTNETGCNEGAEATRCVSHEIEGVRSHVERHLMHGPNSRASVQANTAAVGYTAFATVRSVWWHDPKRMDADELCFERAATINYRGEHRQWESNSLGNRPTMVAVPRPRASKARSTRRGSPTGDTPAAARGECNELSDQFIVSGRNNSYPQQKSTMPTPIKWGAWRRSRYTVSAT